MPVANLPADANADLWVFGYGSLMWRPGFAFEERSHGTIRGYHRALCIFSHVHRGTVEKPGLVLGLDRGGGCKGVAFRVAAARRDETLAYLREREQVTSVYLEAHVRVDLGDGKAAKAVTYVADRKHRQYAGRLDRDHLLAMVRQGVGQSGANPEYVRNTHDHLLEMGVRDAQLQWLVERLG